MLKFISLLSPAIIISAFFAFAPFHAQAKTSVSAKAENFLGQVSLVMGRVKQQASVSVTNKSAINSRKSKLALVLSKRPNAPTNLVSNVINPLWIALLWQDNASNESGFFIERSNNGISFEEIGFTGANSGFFSDLKVIPGNTYWYRVRAFNESELSKYSNLLSVTAL